MRFAAPGLCLLAGLTLLACGDDEGPAATTPIEVTLSHPERCEMFDAGHCLFPFPSDHFVTKDVGTGTGRRLALSPESMPRNVQGVPIDPEEWNRSDGFSPGSVLLLQVPGIDLERSGAPPVTEIGRSLEDGSAVVVVEAESGARHPVWAELDDTAPEGGSRAILIRPARNFAEGRTYVVALSHLRRTDGSTIEPSPAFRAYRDGITTTNAFVEARRAGMEALLDVLEGAGVARDDLYLAWSFTVASTSGLAGRLVAMRDEALGGLEGRAPAFHIDAVEAGTDPGILRVVQGRVEVPRYLTGNGGPLSELNNAGAPDGIPTRNGTQTAHFVCAIPDAAVDAAVPTVILGHGLLGSHEDVRWMAARLGPSLGVAMCGTDWIGMSREDVVSILTTLWDLSRFRRVPDRLQQAHLNFLFLARALKHPEGLRADPAFAGSSGALLTDELSFVGISQGGILGGALCAVAPDWERGLLGVAGMNFSTLLDRSVGFDSFAPLFRYAYPDPLERQLVLDLAQMLWDRGETNGYVEHLTERPLPGTPAKDILLVAAFGDHHVANVASDALARSAGLPVRQPALEVGRSSDVVPFWGIAPIASWPHRGSGYVMWDYGTPAPPTGNLPNREGADPHVRPWNDPRVLAMSARFLQTGWLEDVCDGLPCVGD